MATQRVYSHGLVGFLVVALLALGTGGCGDSSFANRPAVEADNQVPGWVGAEATAYTQVEDAQVICDEPTEGEYETGMPMGYREPGYGDTLETGTVTDDEYSRGGTEGMDDESSETAACYDDEQSSTEQTAECGMVEDDSTHHDTAWTPDVAEEGDPSVQDNDMDDGSMMSSTTDEEEDINPMISEESDDETMYDPNLNDTTSDIDDTSDETPVTEPGNDSDSEPSA